MVSYTDYIMFVHTYNITEQHRARVGGIAMGQSKLLLIIDFVVKHHVKYNNNRFTMCMYMYTESHDHGSGAWLILNLFTAVRDH